jgi:hypothetical protein
LIGPHSLAKVPVWQFTQLGVGVEDDGMDEALTSIWSMAQQSSEEKTDSLDRFVAQVEQLVGLRLVTSGNLHASFKFRFANGIIEGSQPDEDDLRSFLLSFRKFMMNRESVYAPKISNLLWLEVEGAEKKALEGKRAGYQHAMQHGTIALNLNGTSLTPEKNFDVWINGMYFHDDAEKAQQLAERRSNPISASMSKHALLELLAEVTSYLVWLVNRINEWRLAGKLLV